MYASLHIPDLSRLQGKPGEDALIALARMFSPAVETAAPDTVVIPIEPLRRLMGGPHQIASELARRGQEFGLTGNIAIASTPDTAILAATQLPGVTIIPPGDERRHLGSLRLNSLPALSSEAKDILRRWGIRTVEELCELPERGVLERLGGEGFAFLRLARGTTNRPLRTIATPTKYEDRLELEHPVSLIEPLLFLLGRLLNELCGRLEKQSMATTEIRLTLDLEDRTSHMRILQLPFATRDARALLKLMQLDLEAHPPSEPITALSLHLLPVEPRIVQNGLYSPPAPEPEKLELTLSKIRGLVGADNAGSPELLDTHRPDAWRLRPTPPGRQLLVASDSQPPVMRQAFRYYRPPRPARVAVRQGTPHSIWTSNLTATIQEAAGPWRTSGDWWKPDAWNREEWDVRLDNGGLFRLYMTAGGSHNTTAAGTAHSLIPTWFLEGSYD